MRIMQGDERLLVIAHVAPDHPNVLVETSAYRKLLLTKYEFVMTLKESLPYWFQGNRGIREDIPKTLRAVKLDSGMEVPDQLRATIAIDLTKPWSKRQLIEGCELSYHPGGIEVRFPFGEFMDVALEHLKENPRVRTLELRDLWPLQEEWDKMLERVARLESKVPVQA